MSGRSPTLPPEPPTSASEPAIDPSSAAVPAVPRPLAPTPPPTTHPPSFPHFAAAPTAGPEPVSTAPAGARRASAGAVARAAALNRTRAIVGGASVAAFLAILAAVGIHGRAEPASTVRAGSDNAGTSADDSQPAQPEYTPVPFGRRFSGGGFSATPGSGSSGVPNTRSHGS